MRNLLIAVVATLMFSALGFANEASNAQSFKALSAKIWKSPKASSLKNPKDDLAIVYGGEDMSHKLSSQTYTG